MTKEKAVAAEQQAPVGWEPYWMIESVSDAGSPQWWCGVRHWCDSQNAVRFTRKRDAQMTLTTLQSKYGERWPDFDKAIVTEHLDCPPAQPYCKHFWTAGRCEKCGEDEPDAAQPASIEPAAPDTEAGLMERVEDIQAGRDCDGTYDEALTLIRDLALERKARLYMEALGQDPRQHVLVRCPDGHPGCCVAHYGPAWQNAAHTIEEHERHKAALRAAGVEP